LIGVAITVQGRSVQITTGNAALAAFDTGTTLIGGPTADVNAFWAAVPGSARIVGQQQGFFSFRELQFSSLFLKICNAKRASSSSQPALPRFK
jgi:hypothetical protein